MIATVTCCTWACRSVASPAPKHRIAAPWFTQVRSIDVTHFEHWDDAREAEIAAVQNECSLQQAPPRPRAPLSPVSRYCALMPSRLKPKRKISPQNFLRLSP